jgi:hypothetical protein
VSAELGVPIPAVLLGCRKDCAHDRQVGLNEGREVALELGIPFHEASAKLHSGVDEAFNNAIDLARKGMSKGPRAPTTVLGQRRYMIL